MIRYLTEQDHAYITGYPNENWAPHPDWNGEGWYEVTGTIGAGSVGLRRLTTDAPNLPAMPGDFDPSIYYANNPDVRAAGFDAWLHYYLYGRNEGRAYPYGFQAGPVTPTSHDEYGNVTSGATLAQKPGEDWVLNPQWESVLPEAQWIKIPTFDFPTAGPMSGWGFRAQAGLNAITDRLNAKFKAAIDAHLRAQYKAGEAAGNIGTVSFAPLAGMTGSPAWLVVDNAQLRDWFNANGFASDPDAAQYLAWLDSAQQQADSFDDAQEKATAAGVYKAVAIGAGIFGAVAAISAFAAGAGGSGLFSSLTSSYAPALSPLADVYGIVKPIYSVSQAINAPDAGAALSDRADAMYAQQQAAQAQTAASYLDQQAQADAVRASLASVVEDVRASVAMSQALRPDDARAYADRAAATLADASARANLIGAPIPPEYAANVSAAYVAADKSQQAAYAQTLNPAALQSTANGTTALAQESAAQSANGFAIPDAFADYFASAQGQLTPEDYALLQASLGTEYGSPVAARGEGAFPWVLLALAGGYMMIAGKQRKGRK